MKTLYERLGGYNSIAAVIEEAFKRKVTDKQLGRFFVGHGTDSKERIRQSVVNMMCEMSGGPCIYTGRDMRTVHTGLKINESDWNVAVEILTDVFEKFNVPEKEKGELFTAISGLKKDIVGL